MLYDEDPVPGLEERNTELQRELAKERTLSAVRSGRRNASAADKWAAVLSGAQRIRVD